MGVQAIATSSAPFFYQTTSLDGVSYGLRFQYNQREACYYLSIVDTALGQDIISGVKLVTGYYLIRRYAGGDIVGLPPGELLIIPNSTSDIPADVGQLGIGNAFTLYYLDATYLLTGT